MQLKAILRILGIFLMIFSLGMLPPDFMAVFYGDGAGSAFFSAFLVTFFTGLFCWLPVRLNRQELKTRDGFLVVALFWSVLCLFGALPLMLSKHPHLSFIDALFEATSGFTTTGTTVLSGIDKLPHAILYYRQQLQFFGGMGIIVLAVAILPMLGIGGMQLYRAETPGPIKDSKLTPRITQTAKTLWYIYLGLNLACTLAYWASGMSFFDAVCESFSTISTGGFSTHDTSFAFYHSTTINMIATFFMLLSGTNFALHFSALQQKSIRHYWSDSEFKAYIILLLSASLLCTAVLLEHNLYAKVNHAFAASLFTVVSLATTTGLVSAPFDTWPTFLPILIMFIAIIGGCGASTSGGVKVIRALLLFKQTKREVNRLVHPRGIHTIKFNGNVLPEHIIQAMWGFIAVFILLFIILWLMLLGAGLDFTTAFGALAATISNAGASIGDVSGSFEAIPATAKTILIFAMLAGRLEIFTLLLLLTPTYWRG